MIDGREAIIAWTPETCDIRVDYLPALPVNWTDDYLCTAGAAEVDLRSISDAQMERYLLAEFVRLVGQDNIPGREAWLEFCKIKQFRSAMALQND